MLAGDLNRLENDARKLMIEAMNLSMRHLESAGCPHSEGSASHLVHHSVMCFVGAANVLICALRQVIDND